MGQLNPDYQNGVFSKVLSIARTAARGVQITDEDIETGYDLHQAVLFCPPMMVFKLYTFIEQLLSQETSRTIIQTVVNLFHSNVITDETSFKLAKHFYQVFASTIDLQYENILLATSANAQLETIKSKDWPFLSNLTEKCLIESNCSSLLKIYQNLGKFCFSSLFLKLCNHRCHQCLTRAVPPPGPPDP